MQAAYDALRELLDNRDPDYLHRDDRRMIRNALKGALTSQDLVTLKEVVRVGAYYLNADAGGIVKDGGAAKRKAAAAAKLFTKIERIV